MNAEAKIKQHYSSKGLLNTIQEALLASGVDPESLAADDLAPVDEFHTRGRESTLELASLAGLSSNDSLLDVGCGLGGTLRFLAQEYGCKTVGIDLTEDYVRAGRELTAMVGLLDRVQIRQASALDLPFEDATFDVVWTEHAQMNIPDKKRFYSEIARVSKPGGRFLFHDIFAGPGGIPFYPVPWAEDETISALLEEDRARAILEEVGFEVRHWHSKKQDSLTFFQEMAKRLGSQGLPPLGIHLLMGNTAREKLRNYLRNLTEDRVSVALGMAQRT